MYFKNELMQVKSHIFLRYIADCQTHLVQFTKGRHFFRSNNFPYLCVLLPSISKRLNLTYYYFLLVKELI
jgi:hypothetical protein